MRWCETRSSQKKWRIEWFQHVSIFLVRWKHPNRSKSGNATFVKSPIWWLSCSISGEECALAPQVLFIQDIQVQTNMGISWHILIEMWHENNPSKEMHSWSMDCKPRLAGWTVWSLPITTPRKSSASNTFPWMTWSGVFMVRSSVQLCSPSSTHPQLCWFLQNIDLWTFNWFISVQVFSC